MRSLIVELVGVVLIAVGTYLVAGIGPALIVTGTLVLVGEQLYGVGDDDDDEEELDSDEGYSITSVRKVGIG